MLCGVRKEQHAREDRAIYQAKIDKIDAEHLHQTVEALTTVNPTIARELIKNPDPILPLVENSGYTACLYALHALMVPLMGMNYADILNEMSDNNIEILKKCISVARKYPQPKAEVLKAEIARRTEEQKTGRVKVNKDTTRPLKLEERKTNERMLTSFKVTAQFTDNSVWPEVCAELQKWSDAIDGFVRVKDVKVVVTQNTEPKQDKEPKEQSDGETLWTINQLVDELNRAGLVADNKKVYNHRANILTKDPNSQAAKDISAWFTPVGRTLLFKARFFEEYKKLFAQIGRRGQRKNTAKPAPVATVETPATTPKTLSDFMALVAFVTGLVALCEKAKAKLDKANETFNIASQNVAMESNAEKRRDLITEMNKANDAVVAAEKEYNETNELLTEARNLVKAQKDAQSALDAVNAQITAFLAKNKTPQK